MLCIKSAFFLTFSIVTIPKLMIFVRVFLWGIGTYLFVIQANLWLMTLKHNLVFHFLICFANSIIWHGCYV
jgi:hypothetical protein